MATPGIPALSDALPVVLQHHEWFDGQGYPAGLMGGEICLEARILSVADYIRQGSGKQFDPRVVEVFLQIIVDPGRSQTRGSSDSESELSRLAI